MPVSYSNFWGNHLVRKRRFDSDAWRASESDTWSHTYELIHRYLYKHSASEQEDPWYVTCILLAFKWHTSHILLVLTVPRCCNVSLMHVTWHEYPFLTCWTVKNENGIKWYLNDAETIGMALPFTFRSLYRVHQLLDSSIGQCRGYIHRWADYIYIYSKRWSIFVSRIQL